MNKYRIQLGLIIILAVIALSLLLAVNATPDMLPFFAIKRIQEKVFLKTKSTPRDRVDYMSSILESRLQELKNQVNNKSYGYILPSASRYSTLAGQIADLIVANNLADKAEDARKQFLLHRKILDEIYVIYPKNTDNMEYKYIQDDYNYLKLYLDQLEKVK
ncbi:hypothetical protein HYU95_02470 [Candidatus Daviesbacteria bacterium]|nr:hypothetical protein [Candidatus Daviesbacteria bacterium]